MNSFQQTAVLMEMRCVHRDGSMTVWWENLFRGCDFGEREAT